MTGIAYFDQRAKRVRRDDLIESAISTVTELKGLAADDHELVSQIETVERLKKLRSAETVLRLANAQRRRLTGA